MSQPTRSDVHINAPLTNILHAYIQDKANFISDKVFPVVPVKKQSDSYFKYPKDNWFRTEAQKRAPGAESAGSGWNVDSATYSCEVWAHHKDVPDQIRSNEDKPLSMDRDSAEFVGMNLLLRREKDFAAKYFKTGLWTGAADFTPATLWSAANSTPILDVATKIQDVKNKTGFRPDVLVVSSDVNNVLKNNDDVIDRIKYTQRGIVTEELLAAMFGVRKYLVAEAIENTAKEGQTASMANIFNAKDCMLVYAAQRPSILMPSAGYTFTWTGLLGGGAYAGRIKKFRMEHLASDRVEGEMAYDQKVVATDLGCYFDNVIA